MTVTNKAYQESEQAARMTGAAKDTILENALSRYKAELQEDVEDAPAASKQFSRLDKPLQSRIKKYVSEIASLNDPRSRGKALTSNLSGLWRYRIGDYRIMSAFEIYDNRL